MEETKSKIFASRSARLCLFLLVGRKIANDTIACKNETRSEFRHDEKTNVEMKENWNSAMDMGSCVSAVMINDSR